VAVAAVAVAAVAAVTAVAVAAAAEQVAAAAGLGPLLPVVECRHHRNGLEEHIPLGNCVESCTAQLGSCATRSN
jgi:hypothetical protein